MSKINIGFIGAGNMGTAITKGIAGSPAGADISLFAFDPDSSKVASLVEYGVTACGSEAELTEKCGYIFLAVKPQVIEPVIEAAAPAVTPDKVIISKLQAGISDESIASKTISMQRLSSYQRTPPPPRRRSICTFTQ